MFDELFSYDEDTSHEQITNALNFLKELGVELGGKITKNKTDEYRGPFITARKEFTKELFDKIRDRGMKDDDHEHNEEIDNDIITEEERDIHKAVQVMCNSTVDAGLICLINRKGVGNSCVCFEGNQNKPIVKIFFETAKNYIMIGKSKEKISFEKGNHFKLQSYRDEIIALAEEYKAK